MSNYALGLSDILVIFNTNATALAKELNISRGTIYDWINKRRKISNNSLDKLSEFFNLPKDFFIKNLTKSDKSKIKSIMLAKNKKISINKTKKYKDNGLVFTKNSGQKQYVDEVIEYIANEDSAIPLKDFVEYYKDEVGKKGNGSSPTAIYHKLDLPRYFGLIENVSELNDKNKKINKIAITDLGKDYARCNNEGKIDVIFKTLDSVQFGRNNAGVPSSNSNVEAPLAFLKAIVELKSITNNEFGILLFLLHNLNKSFDEAISIIKEYKKNNYISTMKYQIQQYNLGKYFDIKFQKFLKELNIVTLDKGIYTIPKNILDKYKDTILNFDVIKNIDLAQNTINTISKNYIDIDNTLKTYTESSTVDCKISIKEGIKSKSDNITFGNKKTGNTTSKGSGLSNEQKNALGWCGEKLIFNSLNHNEEFLDHLNFKENEQILEVIWYNLGFDKDENWIDKSIGNGHDICIKTNLREIFIEVKTSYSTTNFCSITSNELKKMYLAGDNYYLIKISNFKYINRQDKSLEIIIENNPIDNVLDLNRIKDLTIYIK